MTTITEEGLKAIARTLPCPEDLIKQIDVLKGINKAEQEINVKYAPVSSFPQMDSDELINEIFIDYKTRVCAQKNILEIILTRIAILCEIIFVKKVISEILSEIEHGFSFSSSCDMIQAIENIIGSDDEEDVNRDEMIHNCMQHIGDTGYLADSFSKLLDAIGLYYHFHQMDKEVKKQTIGDIRTLLWSSCESAVNLITDDVKKYEYYDYFINKIVMEFNKGK